VEGKLFDKDALTQKTIKVILQSAQNNEFIGLSAIFAAFKSKIAGTEHVKFFKDICAVLSTPDLRGFYLPDLYKYMVLPSKCTTTVLESFGNDERAKLCCLNSNILYLLNRIMEFKDERATAEIVIDDKLGAKMKAFQSTMKSYGNVLGGRIIYQSPDPIAMIIYGLTMAYNLLLESNHVAKKEEYVVDLPAILDKSHVAVFKCVCDQYFNSACPRYKECLQWALPNIFGCFCNSKAPGIIHTTRVMGDSLLHFLRFNDDILYAYRVLFNGIPPHLDTLFRAYVAHSFDKLRGQMGLDIPQDQIPSAMGEIKEKYNEFRVSAANARDINAFGTLEFAVATFKSFSYYAGYIKFYGGLDGSISFDIHIMNYIENNFVAKSMNAVRAQFGESAGVDLDNEHFLKLYTLEKLFKGLQQ